MDLLAIHALITQDNKTINELSSNELQSYCGTRADFIGRYYEGFLTTDYLSLEQVMFLSTQRINLGYIVELIGPTASRVNEYIETQKNILFQRLTTQEEWFEFNYNLDSECLYLTQANPDGIPAPHCYVCLDRERIAIPDPKNRDIDSDELAYAELLDLIGTTDTPENFQTEFGVVRIKTSFLNSLEGVNKILVHHDEFKSNFKQYRKGGYIT